MRLTEILNPACIKVPLSATEKQPALFELVDVLAQSGAITNVQDVKDAVWEREQQSTTGIGLGIGIPHGKTTCITQVNMAIGLASQGLDYGAIDGQPVQLLVMLASPADQTTAHVKALAKISRMFTDEDFRDAVKQADSAEQLYEMLIQHEAQLAGA